MSAVSGAALLPRGPPVPVPLGSTPVLARGAVERLCGGFAPAAAAAVLVAQRVQRSRARPAQRAAAPVEVSAETWDFDSMADHLRHQERGRDFMELEDRWIAGLICPWCSGGDKCEKSFSIRYRPGVLVCKCWRKNKCGRTQTFRHRGELPARPSLKALVQGGPSPGATSPAERLPGPFPAADPSGRSVPPALNLHMVDLIQEHVDFFISRGISEATWRRTQVCSKRLPKGHGIVFPYYEGDQLVAEKIRMLPKMFWQTKGGQNSLFGFNDVKGQKEVVITEGEIDKLSFDEAGIRWSCSLQSGAGSGLTDGEVELLRCTERVILAVDGDSAGQDCAMKLMQKLDCRSIKCYLVRWPEGCKDANEVLLKHGKEELRRLVDEAELMASPQQALLDNLRLNNEENLDLVRQRVEQTMPSDMIYGVKTGWASLDRRWRLVPGEVTVVTGTPGSGKSEFLLSLAVNLAHLHKYRTLIFAFEATCSTLSKQLYLKASGTCPELAPEDETATGGEEKTDLHYRKVMDWLDQHILIESEFQADDDASLDSILETAREEATNSQLNAVIIDPYNFVERSQAEAKMIEHQFIGRLLQRLKKFAEESRVHVIIVAHPTKENSWNDVKPSLYTIAGSSNWFNKMDNGLVIYRRTFDDEDGTQVATNQLQVSVEKVRNRDAGQLGKSLLCFDQESKCYKDLGFGDAEHLGNPEFESPLAAPLTSRAVNRELVTAADLEEETGEY